MQNNQLNKTTQCLPIKFNSKVKLSWLDCLKFNLKNSLQDKGRILYRDNNNPAKVFIIGSGNRIKQNFLPALTCLDYPVHISAIYSRTFQHASEVGGQWGLNVQAELESEALTNADIIIISITPSNVPSVLKRIQKFTDTSKKVLIVDTPVFAGLKTILSSYLLRRFANVIVTEDYMNYPQFALVRELIKKGKLGGIKKIEINQIGFRYHGLATARSFLEFPLVRSISYHNKSMHYEVNKACEIIVTEPYNKLNGYLHITGDKGTLLYCPKDCENAKEITAQLSADYKLTEQYQDDKFDGFVLTGPEGKQRFSAELFGQIQSLFYSSKDDFNTFKTMGLVEVINSAFNYNINSGYGFVNGLYDNFVTNMTYGRRTFGLPLLKMPFYAIKLLSVVRAGN